MCAFFIQARQQLADGQQSASLDAEMKFEAAQSEIAELKQSLEQISEQLTAEKNEACCFDG